MYSHAYKRYVTVLLLVVYIFNQMDRAVFGFLMQPIKQELGLSDSQLGFLAGPALVLFYATLGIPIARLADRSSRVKVMSGAIALWSLIVTASAAVASFWPFALARVGVGIGEAGFSAIAQALIADYHTSAERARALSIFMLAIPLGGVLSSLTAGWINEAYGWRAVFIIIGLPGLLLALLVRWTVRDSPRALSSVASRHDAVPLGHVFVTLWRCKALKHLAIAMALLNLVSASMITWLPTFFVRSHGMSTGELGAWFALVLGVGGAAGVWASGGLGQRLKVPGERNQAKVLALTAALECPALMAALLWPTRAGALCLLVPASVLMYFFFAPSFALLQGLCAAGMRATMASIVILFQTILAGIVGLQLIGVLSDAFAARYGQEALRWGLISVTPAAIWAAMHYFLAARSMSRNVLDALDDSVGRAEIEA